jgi:maleate isomerase
VTALRPDGWGWRARIGAIIPHADVVPEGELHAVAPDGVSIHTARVPLTVRGATGDLDEPVALTAVREFGQSPKLEEAAGMLGGAALTVIAYAFTSTSYLGTAADEAALRARLERRTSGIPVVTTCAAAVAALGVLGARRLIFVNPPWFPPELTKRGADYFRGQQIEVVESLSVDLPGGQREMHPARIHEWIRERVKASADALFIGGNGFRAVGLIEALEQDLGCAVLTANQVVMWHALRTAGVRARVTGYGSIFER